MAERRPVEMVWLEKQEELYNVEEVLGRDAAAVFPSLNSELDPVERFKTAIGAKKFVTETELEQIKAARGLNVDDGTAAADKPLAEILAERKKAKQDAFEDQWKQMKTGKNRPLDPDELDFLDALARHEARQMNVMQQQEAAELEAYRAAVAAAAESKAAAAESKAAAAASKAAAAAGGGEGIEDAAAAAGPDAGNSVVLRRSGSGAAVAATKLSSKTNSKAAGPVVKPVLKVKAKTAAGQAGAQPDSNSKRQRLDPDVQQQRHSPDAAGGAGLAGLLGEYGSASDEDS